MSTTAVGVRRSAPSALYDYLTTTDHKKIGILYTISSFIFLAIGGLLALGVRAELAMPGLQFLDESSYNQLFTMHGTIMLLMFATPVIYPASLAKGKLATCLWWNPLTPIFESLRYGFLGAGQFSVSALIYSGVFSLVTLVAGVILFNQLEKTFIDSV